MSDDLTRRDFLRHAAAAAAWTSLGASVGAAAQRPSSVRVGQAQRIVVIGAGMAGLATAFELVAQGHDVIVLEARTRPGGRVLTLRDPFADGLYADAGAMQVYDSHTRVQRYLTAFDLGIDPLRPGASGQVVHVRGRRIEVRSGETVVWPLPLSEAERGLDARGLYARYVTPHLAAVHAADTAGTLLSSFAHFDRITYAEFLRGQGASEMAVALLNAGLAMGLGDGGDHHSALNLLREAAYRSLGRQSFTIRGGTDRLPHAFAARLAERIHYGTAVERIEQDDAGVRVHATQGGMRRTFSGDRAVCAVPFAVLRRVAIEPALPAGKRAAIDGLRNTSVVKVFVQTRTRFWIAEGQSGYAATDLPLMTVSERTINQPGARGILEAYVAGANARRLCALPEGERTARIMDDLAQVFPRVTDEYDGVVMKCWDDDEWARGAYAWFAPGEMTALLPHIAAPAGRVHFAGDHTSPTPGWMEGALHSAERVVREIAAASG